MVNQGRQADPSRATLTPPADVRDDATAGLTPSGTPLAAPAAPAIAPDELLAARFRIVRMLGQGGMGQHAHDAEARGQQLVGRDRDRRPHAERDPPGGPGGARDGSA